MHVLASVFATQANQSRLTPVHPRPAAERGAREAPKAWLAGRVCTSRCRLDEDEADKGGEGNVEEVKEAAGDEGVAHWS
jgi:hypothetical protein